MGVTFILLSTVQAYNSSIWGNCLYETKYLKKKIKKKIKILLKKRNN